MLNPVPSLYGVRKFYKYIMINMQISCLVQSPNVLCAYIQEKYQTTVAFPKQVTSHTWLYMDNRWVCIISKLEGKLTVKCTCIMNLQCAERQEFNVLLLSQALECEPSSRPPRDRTERGLALRGSRFLPGPCWSQEKSPCSCACSFASPLTPPFPFPPPSSSLAVAFELQESLGVLTESTNYQASQTDCQLLRTGVFKSAVRGVWHHLRTCWLVRLAFQHKGGLGSLTWEELFILIACLKHFFCQSSSFFI